MALFDEIRDLIVEHLNVPPEKVNLDATFIEDLKADSITMMEFALTLEDKFKVKIPDTDFRQIDTVGKLITYLEEKLNIK